MAAANSREIIEEDEDDEAELEAQRRPQSFPSGLGSQGKKTKVSSNEQQKVHVLAAGTGYRGIELTRERGMNRLSGVHFLQGRQDQVRVG